MFSPELKKGSMELLVLSTLTDQARHGYEIGKLIELRSGRRLEFKVSTLYPVLYRMENRGWIVATWVEEAGERRRRFYRLTSKGRKVLDEQRLQWREFVDAVGMVMEGSHA
jgi:PadR family transcriptional regulator PadR